MAFRNTFWPDSYSPLRGDTVPAPEGLTFTFKAYNGIDVGSGIVLTGIEQALKSVETKIKTKSGFRQAVSTIRQRYFDGVEIMFSDSVQTQADLTKNTEELITEFNDRVAKQPEDKLDLEVLRTVADRTVAGRVSYLVDMAKAEALDALGENRAAVELIEKHLES